jgi:hypothetical protein
MLEVKSDGWRQMLQIRHLVVLAAATSFISFNVVVAQQQTDGNMIVAMGPVSAPQKRGPPVAGPNDPPGCKPSAKMCVERRG